ncbi:NAC domain-containing protein [Vulcanisaeta sp. JCM 16159]|uniref:NAC domain-containing protein n=1 Tax=Vulcanisaeta sp. JCM 16159 TaxID=1295371 RepID=UPI0006CF8EEC|nr:NAC domain-containing protein [Vulcanisaeta sp. JCM 16159]
MGINPREVKRMLKRFGIQDLNLEEVNNVTKVVIYLGDGSTIEINKPMVARMKIQGLSIYQVQASDSDIKVVKPQPTMQQPRTSLIIQQPQQATVQRPHSNMNRVRTISDSSWRRLVALGRRRLRR